LEGSFFEESSFGVLMRSQLKRRPMTRARVAIRIRGDILG